MIFDILSGGFKFVEVLVILAAFALSIVIAITLHEFAHAFTAYKCGDPTAKQHGRMTLNPGAHFEPLGLLCFLFAGIGWAKPVPVNPFNYKNFKKGNFWVSISGILTNLVVAFVVSFGFFLLVRFDLVTIDINMWIVDAKNLFFLGLGFLLMLCMLLNVSLAVFNLLPIPPLDGYNILVSFTKPNNGFMKVMRENAMIVLLLFVIFGGVLLFTVRKFIVDGLLAFWGLFI